MLHLVLYFIVVVVISDDVFECLRGAEDQLTEMGLMIFMWLLSTVLAADVFAGSCYITCL